MTDTSLLARSLLYLPAANARALAKAPTLAADVLILDLEDAVAPPAKEAARAAAVAAADGVDWGYRRVAIRVNGAGTPWHAADLAAAAASAADFIIVPKVESATAAAAAAAAAGGKPLLAMIETPRAVQQADAIADVPAVFGLVAGFNDLARDLGIRVCPGRPALLYAAARMVNAARAAGAMVFDGVWGDIGDTAGLEAEALQAAELGFDGKTCIHPSQLDTVNRAFGPDPAEIARAEAIVAGWEQARAAGLGVTSVDGRLVEELHAAAAADLLAKAAAIHARDAG
jgi:citrate lyase beta subunit